MNCRKTLSGFEIADCSGCVASLFLAMREAVPVKSFSNTYAATSLKIQRATDVALQAICFFFFN